jgi:hypothetical protein
VNRSFCVKQGFKGNRIFLSPLIDFLANRPDFVSHQEFLWQALRDREQEIEGLCRYVAVDLGGAVHNFFQVKCGFDSNHEPSCDCGEYNTTAKDVALEWLFAPGATHADWIDP